MHAANMDQDEIRRCRRHYKLTQKDAAGLLDVHRNSWHNWERGMQPTEPVHREQLANILAGELVPVRSGKGWALRSPEKLRDFLTYAIKTRDRANREVDDAVRHDERPQLKAQRDADHWANVAKNIEEALKARQKWISRNEVRVSAEDLQATDEDFQAWIAGVEAERVELKQKSQAIHVELRGGSGSLRQALDEAFAGMEAEVVALRAENERLMALVEKKPEADQPHTPRAQENRIRDLTAYENEAYDSRMARDATAKKYRDEVAEPTTVRFYPTLRGELSGEASAVGEGVSEFVRIAVVERIERLRRGKPEV
jgi:DNA-binding XRE family transcriptional regulator